MANRFQSRSCNRLSCGAKPQDENLAPNCAYLRRLQAIDFALADLILYLNAYPNSAEALAYYHELREERKQLLSLKKSSRVLHPSSSNLMIANGMQTLRATDISFGFGTRRLLMPITVTSTSRYFRTALLLHPTQVRTVTVRFV